MDSGVNFRFSNPSKVLHPVYLKNYYEGLKGKSLSKMVESDSIFNHNSEIYNSDLKI